MSARWPDSGGGGGGILVEEDPEATPRLDALEPRVDDLETGLPLKQDAATAATDAELTAEAGTRAAADAALASDLADEVADRTNADAAEALARDAAITAAIDGLIGTAPGTYDTLGEIADQLAADSSGIAALSTAIAGKQDLNATLTALSGAPTTAFGIALLNLATASAGRTALGLGTSAVLNVAAAGNAATGEVVKGDDTRLTDARTPTAHTHAQADITGLVAALAAKQDSSTAATDAELTAAINALAAVGVYVNAHGATASTARVSGYAINLWIGSVEPTNAANGDIWVNTA